MVERHHRCNGHELGQTPEDGGGQGGLGYCSPWGHKESTQQGDWTTITLVDPKDTYHIVMYVPAASWHCFLTIFPLFLHSLILLISNCLNLPFRTLGMSRRLKSFSYKQETVDMEIFCIWEGPIGSCLFQYGEWRVYMLKSCKKLSGHGSRPTPQSVTAPTPATGSSKKNCKKL